MSLQSRATRTWESHERVDEEALVVFRELKYSSGVGGEFKVDCTTW